MQASRSWNGRGMGRLRLCIDHILSQGSGADQDLQAKSVCNPTACSPHQRKTSTGHTPRGSGGSAGRGRRPARCGGPGGTTPGTRWPAARGTGPHLEIQWNTTSDVSFARLGLAVPSPAPHTRHAQVYVAKQNLGAAMLCSSTSSLLLSKHRADTVVLRKSPCCA